jgi:salicylate hydroxylase
MKDMRIAIIGAGISGLVAANALQRLGFRPRVYERVTELGEVGAGLTLAPNAMHALNSIGLAHQLEDLGLPPEHASVRHWETGELKITLPRGSEMIEKFGAAYTHIHRADLHGALAGNVIAADPDAIQLGAELTALHDTGSGVDVNFAVGPGIHADVVIGADGLRSTVRRALFGAGKPRFTGYIAFRGLVPINHLPAGTIEPPSSCLSKGPDRSFARYLIRGGRALNFIGLAQRDGWSEEGWSIPASTEEVLAEYEGWHDEVQTIIRSVSAENLFKWALFDREPLEEWTRGHVTLMGDAAHPMLPFLGSGAAMAIEDAVILARAFDSAASIDDALDRYFVARHERTTHVMLQSREAAKAYHSGRDEFSEGQHVTAENLGIWAYNAADVPV